MQTTNENIFVIETSLGHHEIKKHFASQNQKRVIMDRFMEIIQSMTSQICFLNIFPIIYQFDVAFIEFATNYRYRFQFDEINFHCINISMLKRMESRTKTFLRSTETAIQTSLEKFVHVIEIPNAVYVLYKPNVLQFYIDDDLSNMDELCNKVLNLLIQDRIL